MVSAAQNFKDCVRWRWRIVQILRYGARNMITAFFAKWGLKLLGALTVIATALGALGMYGRAKKREGALEEKSDAIEKVQEHVETASRVRREHRANPRDRSRVSKFDRPKPD